MPGRTIPLISNSIYHIYNRGSEKQNIFRQSRDYNRFIKTFFYYQFIGPKLSFSKFKKSNLRLFKPDDDKKIVEILCFCLMPNHFHFLVRQLKENGISVFISQLSNSYTKYFNTKYDRVGALLQGVFKATIIESDEQFIHVSRYIHLNPIVSGISNNLTLYQWSSYLEYIRGPNIYCSTKEILSFFSSRKEYKKFIDDQIDYGTSLELLKHQTIDTHY